MDMTDRGDMERNTWRGKREQKSEMKHKDMTGGHMNKRKDIRKTKTQT